MEKRRLFCLAATGLILGLMIRVTDAGAVDPDLDRTDEAIGAEFEELGEAQEHVLVPMRDGIGLSTNIYLPKDRDGPVPAVFWRTPYRFTPLRTTHKRMALKAMRRGYAFVIQNERGKFFSEGEFEILGYPQTDGVDALDWIAEQDWSNGKVGTLGCSSPAEWQMALAAQDHPAHAAMVPMAPGAGIGKMGPYWEQGNWYRGGAEQMFYPPWLYSAVQSPLRPQLPKGLSQEERARLASYYTLAAKMPEVDWAKAIRHLPLSRMMREVKGPRGTWDDYVSRTPGDPGWREGGLFHDDMKIGVPSLWIYSWFDVSIGPNLALFNHARTNATDRQTARDQFMVVGPNLHCAFFRDNSDLTVGERKMGDASFDYEELIYAFFDRHLKGERNGFRRNNPPVRYFNMGENKWREADQWPPAGTKTRTLYLTSEAGANSLYGDGTLVSEAPETAAADGFTYDPMNPVPSKGGGICCIGDAVEGGVFDQRPIEVRHDVLVYTTAPLESDMDVTGPVGVTLYVSSDAPDTDFTVKLIDVQPDGTAFNVDETIQRVRWREGYDQDPVFMAAGEIYEVSIQPMATATRFKKGHRIRLEVSSSNFPRFSRNLNTGGANYDESEPRVAKNKVHHGPDHPSRLVLTVVED